MKALLKWILAFSVASAPEAYAKSAKKEKGESDVKIRFDANGKPIQGTFDTEEKLSRMLPPGIESEARFQQCDPKIMNSFYENLFLLGCQRSHVSHCPTIWDAAQWATIASTGLFALSMIGPEFRQAFQKAGKIAGQQKYVTALNRSAPPTVLRAGRALRLARRGIGIGLLIAIAWEALDHVSSSDRKCKDKLPYIERDDNCHPRYEDEGEVTVGDQVKEFLALEAGEQDLLLRANPKLCEYYTGFNKFLREKINIGGEVHGIQCNAKPGVHRFQVVDGKSSKQFSLKVAEDHKIEELHVQRPEAPFSSLHQLPEYRMEFAQVDDVQALTVARYTNPFGVERTMNYSELRKLGSSYRRGGDDLSRRANDIFTSFKQHKFYSNLVNTCCSIQNDQTRAQCVSELEGHKGISIADTQTRVNSLAEVPATSVDPTAIAEDSGEVSQNSKD